MATALGASEEPWGASKSHIRAQRNEESQEQEGRDCVVSHRKYQDAAKGKKTQRRWVSAWR